MQILISHMTNNNSNVIIKAQDQKKEHFKKLIILGKISITMSAKILKDSELMSKNLVTLMTILIKTKLVSPTRITKLHLLIRNSLIRIFNSKIRYSTKNLKNKINL